MVHGPIPEMDASCCTAATGSVSNAALVGSDANSVPTATSASARFVVTPVSRTNAALLEANCSGRGGGQNCRPSICSPSLKRSHSRLSVVAAAATLMLCPTIDETTPSNNAPADQGRNPGCFRASAARMGSSNTGIAALAPRTAEAQCTSRSLLPDPMISSVRASICRTERQTTWFASQPTQTNAPRRASTFGHRPRAHHAGATVLARSNGGDTVTLLLSGPELITASHYGVSPVLLVNSSFPLLPIVALGRATRYPIS